MVRRAEHAAGLVRVAEETDDLDAFRLARIAVRGIQSARTRDPLSSRLDRLPLGDPSTYMIAAAVARTIDLARTTPRPLEYRDGFKIVSFRRAGPPSVLAEIGEGRGVALEAIVAIDDRRLITVASITLTNYDAQEHAAELPVADGQLNIEGVRTLADGARHEYGQQAAMLNIRPQIGL